MKNKLEKLKGFPLSLQQKKQLIELLEDKPKEVDIYYDAVSGKIKVGEFETDVSMDVSEDEKTMYIILVNAKIDKFLKDVKDVNFIVSDLKSVSKLRNVSYYTEEFPHKSYYGFRNIESVSVDLYLMVTNYIPN